MELPPLQANLNSESVGQPINILIDIRQGINYLNKDGINRNARLIKLKDELSEALAIDHSGPVTYAFVDTRETTWDMWHTLLNLAAIQHTDLYGPYVADHASYKGKCGMAGDSVVMIATSEGVQDPRTIVGNPSVFMGILCCKIYRQEIGEITSLFAKPRSAGGIAGVGTALYDAALAILFRLGAKRVTLSSLRAVTGFYSRMGMSLVGGDSDRNEVHMHRDSPRATFADFKADDYKNRTKATVNCGAIMEAGECKSSFERVEDNGFNKGQDPCVLHNVGTGPRCVSLSHLISSETMTVDNLRNSVKGRFPALEAGEVKAGDLEEGELMVGGMKLIEVEIGGGAQTSPIRAGSAKRRAETQLDREGVKTPLLYERVKQC